METVGIRELKANLSHYLKQAKKGKHFIVTSRGKEMAELTPVTLEDDDPIVAQVRRMLEARKGKNIKPVFPKKRIKIKGKPLSETILEDRGAPIP